MGWPPTVLVVSGVQFVEITGGFETMTLLDWPVTLNTNWFERTEADQGSD